jgi:hypothetical protein
MCEKSGNMIFSRICSRGNQYAYLLGDRKLIKKSGEDVVRMDKTGVASLIAGIILLILGVYGVWIFLPDVIIFLKGVIGILAILIGIFLLIFGAILVKD